MPNMKNTLTLLLFAVAVMFMTGCGNPKVSGKVMFTDGEPLTTGNIMFENDQNTYRCDIRSDGTFDMGMLRDGEGLPPGEYRVAVVAVCPESAAAHNLDPDLPLRMLTPSKFTNSRTSGITYTVTDSTRNIEIVVERAP